VQPLALGVRYPDGAPLFQEIDADDLIARLAGVTADAKRVAAAPWVFDERARRQQPRLDEPSEAGWTYVVADDDPDCDGIIAALEALARYRGMATPDQPLRFPSGADRGDWIDDVYKGLGDHRPRYLLLAGGPADLSFPLQVDLAAAGAFVGRVAFSGSDRLDAYREYGSKVMRFEAADDPTPTAAATVVATDGGRLDATTYSSRFLGPPVAKRLREDEIDVTEVTGPQATKEGLRSALMAGQPALLFTATHGAGTAGGPGQAVDPRDVNGAWACAPAEPGRRPNDWDWLVAADLPDGAMVPGGAVVQFACFGYGTTDQTSFAAWLGNPNVVEVPEPFVAAIPQRLLANPDGPIAYVGHVDVAVAHGFVELGAPEPAAGFYPRAQPFLSLVAKGIAESAPMGYALRDLHERAAAIGSEIVSTFDRLEQANIDVADLQDADKNRLIDKVIRRNDAMHFLLLGDPGARVRIRVG
jgi:hypothetical protein